MGNSKSVVGIEPGDCSVVIGYQVDDFTHTWLLEHFGAWSHIYPALIGKVSTLSYIQLELGCEDYSFVDQAVADFEHSHGSILTDSIKTPEYECLLWWDCYHVFPSLFRVSIPS